jgi:membrane protease subunit (stomatin/prohibitin family)
VVDNVVDPETQLAIGLRVFGDYSLKVVDPTALILNLVGSRDAAEQRARDGLDARHGPQDDPHRRRGHIVQNNWPILGIAAHTDDLEAETIAKVETHVSSYGVHIVRMGNFTISINDTDEETLKKYRRDVTYSKLAGGFQQYGAGEAMIGLGEGAAKGGGNAGGARSWDGRRPRQPRRRDESATAAPPAAQQQAAPAAAPPVVHCTGCGAVVAPGAKFCSGCGVALATPAPACPSCGAAAEPGAKFCGGCGTKLG